MRVAIIVLAHRSPAQLALLLSHLQHPDVRVYLHLDRRSPLAAFRRELVGRGSPSFSMIGRRRSRWGGIEVVDATMEGLSRGVSDGCGYFFLISGQDFPIVPMARIIEFARRSRDRSFLEFFPFPVEKWRFGGRLRTEFYTYTIFGGRETFIPGGEEATFSWKGRLLNELLRIRTLLKPPRRFPPYLQAYGGSQWWNLNREAAEFVLRFVDDHPDYRAYHRYSLLPDEMFFQSILLGSSFAETREVANDSLRFMIWMPGASHPKSLTVDDLPRILASGKLFARKIDEGVDGSALPELVRRLE